MRSLPDDPEKGVSLSYLGNAGWHITAGSTVILLDVDADSACAAEMFKLLLYEVSQQLTSAGKHCHKEGSGRFASSRWEGPEPLRLSVLLMLL